MMLYVSPFKKSQMATDPFHPLTKQNHYGKE